MEQAFDILLVEDNDDHAELAKLALSGHQISNNLHRVADGNEAIEYVYNEGRYSDTQKYRQPKLILLDLRLPKMDGIEVLKRIKDDPEKRGIPVVILSTSNARNDIENAKKHHANSYLVKPLEYKAFCNLMKDLGFYWLAWNQS